MHNKSGVLQDMHNTSGTLVSETIIEKKKRFPAHTHTHTRTAVEMELGWKKGNRRRKAAKRMTIQTGATCLARSR